MICKLRKTFRVSLQCHLEATSGSRACRRLYRERAASGSSAANGGISGRASNNSRISDVICESADDSPSEGGGLLGGDDEFGSVTCSGSTASRPGKARCWIQYAVPPTTMGTFFNWCASLIWAQTILARAASKPEGRTHCLDSVVNPLTDHILLGGFFEIHENVVDSRSLSRRDLVR